MSGTKKIPFFGIDRQYQSIKEEILEVTDSVYSSGQTLDGPNTRLFEKTIARMTERKYAVSVNSGTQALIFALRILDDLMMANRNVLIPAQSFIATLNSVVEAELTPSFVDVDPSTGLMNLSKIPLVSEDIGALMFVNLFGNILDQDSLISYLETWTNGGSFPIIEDAAQSFGAYYRGVPSGKFGDVSILSFDPTKNLNNYGSGGMILTDNIMIYESAMSLRDNGKFSDHIHSGTNSKISEADSAQMLVKLKHFDDWQKRRTDIASYYDDELSEYVDIPERNPKVEHAWSKYVIHHPYRMLLRDALDANGIETKLNYEHPLHHNAMANYSLYSDMDLRGAEEFSKTCLSLPIYPELTDVEVETIVDCIKNYSTF